MEKTRYWGKIFFGFIIAIITFCVPCYAYGAYDVKNNVTDKYFSGEYEIVEGIIYDYDATERDSSGVDEFYVNDIWFSLCSFTGYGYDIQQYEGGVLKNGMQVRICYIPYKYENVVMKLEAVIED